MDNEASNSQKKNYDITKTAISSQSSNGSLKNFYSTFTTLLSKFSLNGFPISLHDFCKNKKKSTKNRERIEIPKYQYSKVLILPTNFKVSKICLVKVQITVLRICDKNFKTIDWRFTKKLPLLVKNKNIEKCF